MASLQKTLDENFENFNFELVKPIEKIKKHNMVIYVLFFVFFEESGFTLVKTDELLQGYRFARKRKRQEKHKG